MNSLKHRPMAIIGFAALGIMLITILSGYIFEGGAVAVAVGAVLLTVTVISKKLREVTVLFYLSAAFLFAGVLMVANSSCSYDSAVKLSGENVTVTATVTGESDFSASKSIYILETDSVADEELNVKLRLKSNTSLGFYAGDKVKFTADVYSIDSFSDSLKRYYMSEGIYLGATLYDAQNSVEVIENGSDTLTCKLQLLRDLIKSRIYSLLPNEYGGVAVAMLLGDNSGVSDETYGNFKLTGISHLFAVSGLHLSIWVLGVFELLKKAGLNRISNSAVAIIFTVFLMALTGFTPSINRAGLMLIVLMSGNLFGRRSDSLNSLGFALFIILAFNPMSATSVSLLLSVGATLGIIVLYPKIDKYLSLLLGRIKIEIIRKPVSGVVSVFAVSVAATVFTLPVNAVVFGFISLIGPITNILVSYPSTLMMLTAGITAVTQPVLSVAKLSALVCGLCAKYIIFIADKLADVPFAVIETDNIIFEVSFILLLCASVCCFIIFKEKQKIFKSVVALAVSISVISSSVHLIYNHNLTTVKIIDVDDGICAVIENSGEKAVLGCGSSDEYALSDVTDSVFDKNASLLIVPNSNTWNSSLVSDLSQNINFDRIISGENIDNLDSVVVSDFQLNPWDGASINFHHGEDLTYAYCVFDGTDMLIVFDSDKASLPTEYLDAEILLCLYYLPENQDLSGFGNIIISSTKEVSEDMAKLYAVQNGNIYSTSGVNDVILEIRNDNIRIIYN